MGVHKINTKELSHLLGKIASYSKSHKGEIASAKKLAKLGLKLAADSLKPGKSKKLIHSIKKTNDGRIKVKVDTGSGKTREYFFKAKKLSLSKH
jgi:lysophospholipid acyltransferase (LPLAT)-like uncharacterized protein